MTTSRPLGEPARRSGRFGRIAGVLGVLACTGPALASCSSNSPSAGSKPGVIVAIGAENEYANVLGQIGGRYVQVSSILDNPNTDPHTFEASPSVAQKVSA